MFELNFQISFIPYGVPKSAYWLYRGYRYKKHNVNARNWF